MKDVYDKLTMEDLTEDLQYLAEACGMEGARNVLRNYAGVSFYIPHVARFDGFVERYLENNKDKSVKTLSIELKTSEQHIRNKLKALRNKKQN